MTVDISLTEKIQRAFNSQKVSQWVLSVVPTQNGCTVTWKKGDSTKWCEITHTFSYMATFAGEPDKIFMGRNFDTFIRYIAIEIHFDNTNEMFAV